VELITRIKRYFLNVGVSNIGL